MRPAPLVAAPLLAVLALAGCIPADDRPGEAPTPSSASSAPASSVPTGQPAPPSDSPKPMPGADECGAGKLGAYVNQLPSGEALAQIRAAIGHDRIRTIKPDDAVTMDFRPDRLNVELGEDGRIRLLRCG